MLKSDLPALTLVTNSSVTDHNAALLTLTLKLPKPKYTKLISKLDHIGLEDDLRNIDLKPIHNSTNAETCMSHLISNIQQIIHNNTKCVKISRKNINIKAWITPGLIRCMRHRDKLHMKAKACSNNLILQTTYKRYRKFCNGFLKKSSQTLIKNY